MELMAELFGSSQVVSRVVPITNTGTECFMNAAFQAIIHDDLLKNAILTTYQNKTTPEARDLCEAIDLYSQGKRISLSALRQFMPEDFREGQQDASEFLNQLLNNVTFENYPESFPTQTIKYYWLQVGSDTEGKETHESKQVFYTAIEIPSQEQTISGQDLIHQYFARKKHEGELWLDGDTNILYEPGELQVQIEGKRVTFLLKRFNQNNKISTPVDMPEILDLNSKKYALKKVIVHHGQSMWSGHYTSLLQIAGQWIKTDDIRISNAQDNSTDRQNGYIYFYELIEEAKIDEI